MGQGWDKSGTNVGHGWDTMGHRGHSGTLWDTVGQIQDREVMMKEYDYWNRLSIDDLLWTVEDIARERYDGHYTIMKFTTHYKAMFRTPDLDSHKGRIQVRGLLSFSTFKEALIGLLMAERILIFQPQDRRLNAR